MFTTDLSEPQWELVAPAIKNSPPLAQPRRPRGRPRKTRGRPFTDDHAVLDGILHVLLHQIPWNQLPPSGPNGGYPSYITCYRRYTVWVKNGTWDAILTILLDDLRTRTGYDLWREWTAFTMRVNAGDRSLRFNAPRAIKEVDADSIVFGLFLLHLADLVRDDDRRTKGQEDD